MEPSGDTSSAASGAASVEKAANSGGAMDGASSSSSSSSAGGGGGDAAAAASAAVLDEGLFAGHSALLAACQAYAELTGCRFRASSFEALPGCAALVSGAEDGESSDEDLDEPDYVVVPFPSSCGHGGKLSPRGWQELGEDSAEQRLPRQDPAPLQEAKRRAAPAVRRFARRLRRGEPPELVEELNRAFFLTMEEALRRSMVAAFQRLDLWPPRPAPRGVREDDCEYEDLGRSMAVIAQRTFNDELRRERDRDLSLGGVSRPQRRAMTAAFLVDFASEVGVQLPSMNEDQQRRFELFETKVVALEESQRRREQRRQELEQRRQRQQQHQQRHPFATSSSSLAAGGDEAALLAGGSLVGSVAAMGRMLARWGRGFSISSDEGEDEEGGGSSSGGAGGAGAGRRAAASGGGTEGAAASGGAAGGGGFAACGGGAAGRVGQVVRELVAAA